MGRLQVSVEVDSVPMAARLCFVSAGAVLLGGRGQLGLETGVAAPVERGEHDCGEIFEGGHRREFRVRRRVQNVVLVQRRQT